VPTQTTIDIDRPPEVVFGYLTDPARFAEWQPDVLHVQVDGDRQPRLGATFTTTRRIGRAERTMTQRVTEYAPPHRWAAEAVAGPIRPGAGITIEPLDSGTRSRVTFTLDLAGHGVGVALVPMVRRMAARGAPASYRNATHHLEDTRW
jgi:uncharacterized protein YndB with AHSA1/START domain